MIAPLKIERPVPPHAWIEVVPGETDARPCGWSPDGSLLYFVSSRDGMRCLYAQRVNRVSGASIGVRRTPLSRQSYRSWDRAQRVVHRSHQRHRRRFLLLRSQCVVRKHLDSFKTIALKHELSQRVRRAEIPRHMRAKVTLLENGFVHAPASAVHGRGLLDAGVMRSGDARA
jgi:hypothetical protein